MPFIAFLGCDGSGKSAVIAALAAEARTKGVPVATGHWRPFPFRGHSNQGASGADDPHGAEPRGGMASVAKLGWLWLNWWVGWFRFLRSDAAFGAVLFDRYHVDLLVDPDRYRYGGPLWLARLASSWMPQPDIVIYLDAPPDVLLSRKQEVPRAALERSRAAYLELAASQARFRIVDAARPLEQVIEEVCGKIR